jgi:hypothetical protein
MLLRRGEVIDSGSQPHHTCEEESLFRKHREAHVGNTVSLVLSSPTTIVLHVQEATQESEA